MKLQNFLISLTVYIPMPIFPSNHPEKKKNKNRKKIKPKKSFFFLIKQNKK